MHDQKMNDLQRNIAACAAKVGALETDGLALKERLASLITEKEGGEFVQEMMQNFLSKKTM